jgi:4'-phosphopantetheinyl transferase
MSNPGQFDHEHRCDCFRAPILCVADAVAILVESSGRASDAELTDALRAATGDARLLIGRRPSGRPRLMPPLAELGVSLARRGTVTAAAFEARTAVGVDLEREDADLDCVRLARDHFAAREAQQIAAESGDCRREFFLRLWCAKEAMLKISGRGVVDGMDDPDLSGVLDLLRHDGVVASVPGGARCPAARVATRRVNRGPDVLYVALAVAS